MIDDGPFYSGRGFGIAPRGTKFSLNIAVARPNALQMGRDMQVGAGTWLSEGQQFGLEKFQQIAGVKNGKPTASTTYRIASNYYGKMASGSTVDIRCSGDDLSEVLACEMAIDAVPGILLTVRIPTENFALWAKYAEVAETYFRTHLE